MAAAEAAVKDRVPGFFASLDRGDRIRLAVITVLFLFAFFVLPGMLSSYWTSIFTADVSGCSRPFSACLAWAG